MPSHVLAGHLVAVLAPFTAAVALVYALRPRARAGMRATLVASAVATMAGLLWAATAGASLLAAVKANGSAAEAAAATAHAHGSNALAAAALTLLVVVLATVWWVLRPARTGVGTSLAAGLLAVCALAVLVTTWLVVGDALTAVWSHHLAWRA